MAHILLVAKGTGGDLVPFPKIGQELKKHGHRITLLSHCSYAGMAQQNDWDFVALDTPEQRQQIIDDGQLLNRPAGYPAYFRRHIFPRVAAEYEAIRARYVPGETVVVTTHKACLTPLLAAEKLGIPLVRLFATVSELITLPLMEGMYQSVLGEDLNGARTSIGLPPLARGNAWLRKADRELALWPDWFAAPDGDWVVPAVPVGFIQETGEDLSAGLLETLTGAEAPILVTAGTGLFTDPRFYSASAAACRQLDRPGILVTRYPQLVPNDLPQQVRHFEYLPFASLMPHVAAVIHHGGVGSLACALAAGVPQLVLAAGGDRPENGERIQRLGVGECLLPPHWEAGSIASALERLLNSAAVRENCRAFALRLRASDAAAEARKWIESIIPTAAETDLSSSSQTKAPTIALDSKKATAQLMRKLSPEKQALLAQKLRKKLKQNPNRFRAEQGIIHGSVPLTPNQNWFFELNNPHPEEWLLDLEVETRVKLEPEQLKQMIKVLMNHHDTLRTRFIRKGREWHQFIIEQDENIPVSYTDLSTLPEAQQDADMQTIAQQWRNSLNLAEGPVIRTIYFNLGAQRPGRLLFIVHHLIIDAYSLQILAADFQTIYRQMMQGESIKLASKTTSYKEWSEKLFGYAQSVALNDELNYWRGLPWERVGYIPLDMGNESVNTVGSARTYEASLSIDDTKALLKTYPALQKSLLAALGQTLAHWAESPYVIITLIINGREAIFKDIDLSRTVGLFSIGSPVVLDMKNTETPAKALSAVNEQMARIPSRGMSYGILHLSKLKKTNRELKKLDQLSYCKKVVFNYIPPIGPGLPDDAPFRPVVKTLDLKEDLQNMQHYVLKCTASILQDQLVCYWEYSTNLHRTDTIESIAQFYLEKLRSFI